MVKGRELIRDRICRRHCGPFAKRTGKARPGHVGTDRGTAVPGRDDMHKMEREFCRSLRKAAVLAAFFRPASDLQSQIGSNEWHTHPTGLASVRRARDFMISIIRPTLS